MALALGGPAAGATLDRSAALNSYGMPGLIDMPTARSLPDAELGLTLTRAGGMSRNTLTFQFTPWLTGSFRYSNLDGFGASELDLWDRSFDVHVQLAEEFDYWPALAVGLRDLIGTGVYSSEYVVMTKTLTPGLSATAGLGWGRLGSFGDIGTAFGDRPEIDFGEGGKPNIDQWFRGPAAPFAGLEWRPNKRWSLMAEYSSDAYTEEELGGLIDHRSPFNFGVSYRPRPGVSLNAYSLHGDEIGLTAAFTLNPKRPPNDGSRDPAPFPVQPRGPGPHDNAWAADLAATQAQRTRVAGILSAEGFDVQTVALDATRVRVRVANLRYDYEPQAIGRIARLLTGVLPASVETIEIIPVAEGIGLSVVTLRRSDIEELEHEPEGARLSYARATIEAAPRRGPGDIPVPGRFPRFEWGVGPYLSTALFDPDNPIRADLGLELSASYEMAPGLVLSGALRGKVVGNRDAASRPSDSVLPRVRSDYARYHKEGEFGIHYLTLEHFGHPAPDLYSRLSFGYLETMYGGVSGELLWKPVDQRWALGMEVNYARQRDFDAGFGFQDYDVVTGHGSLYLDLGGGYVGQVDVGRYLAGDWGTTLSFDRTFDNGWSVGAYATFTDVGFDDFGEGSFDKGLRLEVPLSWFAGTSTRQKSNFTIQPITRDGGARLNVRNRLYGLVSDYHRYEMHDEWGRFWR